MIGCDIADDGFQMQGEEELPEVKVDFQVKMHVKGLLLVDVFFFFLLFIIYFLSCLGVYFFLFIYFLYSFLTFRKTMCFRRHF